VSQFSDTIKAAVSDLLLHGYDSQERLQTWLSKLYGAANQSLVPAGMIQSRLASALSNVYHKQINSDKFLNKHAGVSKFTIEQIKPRLRSELERRILASADLIKMNREASIQRTLHRFAGWASSIPKGGTKSEKRTEVDKDLRKSFTRLPFEERRVIIDQGHKLVGAINSIIAEDGGAIAGIWHSHWRETGYDFRPRHKQFDTRIFVLRNNWAMRDGLMKLAGRFYTDQIEQPAVEIYCRCYYQYLYLLEDLPKDMLTSKGKELLLARGKRHAA